MDTVVTVGFLVACVAFLKAQFGLTGPKALGAALGVGLVVLYLPVFEGQFPALTVWLDPLSKLVGLVVGGAGSFDFAKEVAGYVGNPKV